ncbi:MAG TPA: biopolymer transporter ExbD, partial [Pirellulales bacterium]
QDETPAINLAPMIDIVFLLLIFFMTATHFIDHEKTIPLEVPEVPDRGALLDAPSERIVNVFRDGSMTLDGQDVNLDELTQRLVSLRSQYPALAVAVRGDGVAEYQLVAGAFNACRQAGVTQLAMALRVQSDVK